MNAARPGADAAANVAENTVPIGEKKRFSIVGFFSSHPLLVEFLIIFILFFIRFVVYGFRYYRQSGDYELFNNYAQIFSTTEKSFVKFFGVSGMMASKPLTFLSGVFVWAKTYGNMIVALAVFSLMYAASAVMLRYVFNKMFGTGYFFTAVFCLVPATLEGVYVMNHAAALVPSIFFTSLAVLSMYLFRVTRKFRYLPVFAFSHLLVFFFDERIAVLASVLLIVTALVGRNKYSVSAILIIGNACLYSLYIQLGRLLWDGNSAIQLVIPFSKGYVSSTLAPVARESAGALSNLLPVGIFSDFFRGMKNVFADGRVLYLIAVVLLCAVVFLVLRKKGDERAASGDAVRTLLLSLLFVAAPLIPALFLKDSGVAAVEAVPSICGIALFGDTLLRLISRGKRYVCVPVITLFAFVCCIGAVSEMHDYRLVSEFDAESARSVVKLVNDSFEPDDLENVSNIAIINIKGVPRDELADLGGETVASACDNAESFTEMLKAESGNGRFPTVTPIPVDKDGYFYRESDGDSLRVENFENIFVATDYAMIRVISARGFTVDDYNPRANYENYLLYTTDFTRLAHVSEYSTHGIFKFY